jgi:hypothetical protein
VDVERLDVGSESVVWGNFRNDANVWHRKGSGVSCLLFAVCPGE